MKRKRAIAKRIDMKQIKLTRQERKIEEALLRGEYVKASRAEHVQLAKKLDALKARTARTSVRKSRSFRREVEVLISEDRKLLKRLA